MPQPHFTLTISASAVAWYAAIVSTVSSTIQFATFVRDRVRVKVKVQRDMEMVGDPLREGMSLTMITVTNEGRRPVTITNIGMMYLQDKGAIFPDTTPHLPCELTEGKYATALVNQEGLLFDEIRRFSAYDSTGREYKRNFAPWRKRAAWAIRRRIRRRTRQR